MIIDVTGVVLTPGNGGVNCLGNGSFYASAQQNRIGSLPYCANGATPGKPPRGS